MAANESPDRSESLGVFSLKAASWGFIIPILFVLLLVALRADLAAGDQARVTRLLAVLFGGMEVIALLSGFIAWSSRAGKTGVLLALVFLVGGAIYAGVELKWIGGEKPKAAEPTRSAAAPSAPRSAEPAPVILAPAEPKPVVPAEPLRGRAPGELFPNVPPQN